MNPMRSYAATFHKSDGNRLTLFSVTTLTQEISGHDGRAYLSRTEYDVDYSRRYGYIWRETGGGGNRVIEVRGIYFSSGDIQVREKPTRLVDPLDNPPWKGRRTRAIRQRNRTRRLKALPKAFDLRDGEDLIGWLERNAIEDDAVFCSTCADITTGQDLCEHTWWCDRTCWYSTPTERCDCKNREQCREDR